ncbi:MAG: Spy/CpxP family protein refolding chaperone [candidate division KSB1 bacterium]|nr:Spy/CpxP family protein refolding chaperone [candidate division KSB1 bacterium]MDZ7317517.1 Spy/CpxP family protein refolding chaperone [candidate division KSB1 bacterium]
MKRITSLATAICTVLLASLLLAQPGHRGPMRCTAAGTPFAALNLTDDQKTKLEDLRLAHQKEMLPLRTELQSKMASLRLLQTEEKPDLKKIDQLIDDTQVIRSKMQKARVRHHLEIRKLLTPEQQKKFDSRMLMAPGKHGMGCSCSGSGKEL